MKRLKVKALLIVLLVALCLGGSAWAQTKTIVYIGHATSNTFWNHLGAMAKAEAAAMKVKFIDLTPPEPSPDEQKKAFENAILQKVSGIIIGATDNRAFGESLKKAKAAKIPVVAVDTGIDDPIVASLVQTDNLKSAKIAGKYIVGKMTKPGKLLILGGTLGHQTGDARRDGVAQVAMDAGITVIYRACDWDETKAYETCQNELAANPDITAIFGAWDPAAMAARAEVKEKGLMGKIVICGFDGNPANLKAIKAGEIDATIKQDNDKMGKDAADLIIKINKGKKVDKFYPIDGFVIDASNVDKYL